MDIRWKSGGHWAALLLIVLLWMGVIIYGISSLLITFIDSESSAMSVVSTVLLIIVCLPVAIIIFGSDNDKFTKHISLGLVGYILLIICSDLILYILPINMDVSLWTVSGQVLFILAYLILAVSLFLAGILNGQHNQRKLNNASLAIFFITLACTCAVILFRFDGLELNGAGIIFNGAFIVFDIILLIAIIRILLSDFPGSYKSLPGILMGYFFMQLVADIFCLWALQALDTSVSINYLPGYADLLYSASDIFLTSTLLLYMAWNLNPFAVRTIKEELDNTQSLMSDLIAQSPDAIGMLNVSGNLVKMNDQFSQTFGSRLSATGKPWNAFDQLLEAGISGEKISKLKSGESLVFPLWQYPGSDRFFSLKMYSSFSVKKIISGYVIVLEDITERIQAEDRLKTSLEEKNVLLKDIQASLEEKNAMLKEIHHRVKNNLQIISSLLNLQAGYITDERALEAFSESRNRVKSMALVHERLYMSDNLSKVNFHEYISNLSEFLMSTYKTTAASVRMDTQIADITMSIDVAIPCGLIINELITNSLKYAFPGNRPGTICVEMHVEGDTNVLSISDDGIGFPGDIDFRNTASLGMQLVVVLTGQIEGTIDLAREKGTRFTIKFPARTTLAENIL